MQYQYPNLRLLITDDQWTWSLPNIRLFFMKHDYPISSKTQSAQLNKSYKNVLYVKDLIESKKVINLKSMILSFIYPLVESCVFSVSGALIIFLAILAQATANIFFHIKLPFTASCRLLTVSATPPMAILCTLATINIYFTPIIYLIIFIGYFSYALRSVRRSGLYSSTKISFRRRFTRELQL